MKNYKRTLLLLSLPIAAQNLVAFVANLVDTVMIGQLSETSFAATSLANQVFFIITLVISGISGGSNVILSQMWGRQDKEGMYKILAYTYRASIIFVLIVAFLAIAFPDAIMHLLTSDQELIRIGAQYLRIVGISYLFFGISSTTIQILRSANVVKISMISSFTALIVNMFLNYCLIFGNFGFPQLGVQGAAIATVIARFVELLVVLFYIYHVEDQLQLRIYKIKKTNHIYWHSFVSNCAPVAFNELMWSLGESMVVMIIGRMGLSMVSAISIYNVLTQLSNVLMNGFDSAACVMVGNTLGVKDYDLLHKQIKVFKRLAIIIGIIDGLFMICSIPATFVIYKISEETKNVLISILLLGSIIEVFKSMQCMNMMGILRGGGDVRFAALNDIIFLWLLVLPLGYLGAFVLHWHYLLVFFCIKSDQIIKYFTSEWRTRQSNNLKYIEV